MSTSTWVMQVLSGKLTAAEQAASELKAAMQADAAQALARHQDELTRCGLHAQTTIADLQTQVPSVTTYQPPHVPRPPLPMLHCALLYCTTDDFAGYNSAGSCLPWMVMASLEWIQAFAKLSVVLTCC